MGNKHKSPMFPDATVKPKRRVVVPVAPLSTKAVDAVGKVPSPSVQAIIQELQLSIGECLIELRGSIMSVRDRALTISHLTRSIHSLVQLVKLEELDVAKLSDDELSAYAKKIMESVN